jgi:hypothetical protein
MDAVVSQIATHELETHNPKDGQPRANISTLTVETKDF